MTSIPALIQSTTTSQTAIEESPFLLENESAYQAWKRWKLSELARVRPLQVTDLSTNSLLNATLLKALLAQVDAHGFGLFSAKCNFTKIDLLRFAKSVGLHSLVHNLGTDQDGISSLRFANQEDPLSRYIPYTKRALNWHTDGYYNHAGSRIGSFILYCVNPAQQGGESYTLDHELLYMCIRDLNPELLRVLMNPDAMEIPANIENNKVVRSAETGPVFSVDTQTGDLHMRYSARPRNIIWSEDALARRAVNLIREFLIDSEYVNEFRLQRGQGIICRNILHGRRAFVNGNDWATSRLYYRARFAESPSTPQ